MRTEGLARAFLSEGPFFFRSVFWGPSLSAFYRRPSVRSDPSGFRFDLKDVCAANRSLPLRTIPSLGRTAFVSISLRGELVVGLVAIAWG